MQKYDKIIIGRKEKACFPDLNIDKIDVKIDSGAYSCSIDCSHISEVYHNNHRVLEVVFLQHHDEKFTNEKLYFKEFSQKKVTSSSGNSQVRYIIDLKIKLFGKDYTAPFSLTNRSGLKTPILIGRKLLNRNFLIDTSKKYLSNKYFK
jgi:hypothetical protein